MLQILLQSHADDDMKLALTGIPVLPVHELAIVRFLYVLILCLNEIC